jgi:hypothetical protein
MVHVSRQLHEVTEMQISINIRRLKFLNGFLKKKKKLEWQIQGIYVQATP